MDKLSMKKKRSILFLSVLITVLVYSTCDEAESETDKGKKAAAEFCSCLDDGYSMSKCNEKFHDKYGNNFTSSFIESFNKEGDKCNIKANKE